MKLAHFLYVASLLLFSIPWAVFAYEVETHAKISQSAAGKSVLNDNSTTGVLRALGLNAPIDDETHTQDFPNSEGEFENIITLIADGSRFEDGFLCSDPRPRNHFFDPTSGSGLDWTVQLYNGTDLVHATGIASPDWALEDTGKQSNQDYSWKSAREYFYRALTAPNRDDRDQFFGLGFQTIGHIVHHIEDMAQPQHVRNDVHYASPPNCGIATYLGKLIKESPSRYESHTNLVRDQLLNNTSLLDSYPPVNDKVDTNFFLSARQFWISGGKGIAEFTNANFLSAGTNFDTNRYPSPSLAQAVAQTSVDANQLLAQVGISVPVECQPPKPACTITFYTTHVDDKYRPTASGDNLRASTYSIFDQDLIAKGASPTFSLNRFNFDAAHQFLIPRAVAYSAGLINYFFRGRLEPKDVQYTDSGVSLRVKNSIDLTQTPQYSGEVLTTGGKLVIGFDYKIPDSSVPEGFRKGVGASNEILLSENFLPGQVSDLSTSLWRFS